MKACLNIKVAGILPVKMRLHWSWRSVCVMIVLYCVVFYGGVTEGCPCDPVGASNSQDCQINSSYRCLCRAGYKGLNCSMCKEDYYRPVLPHVGDQLNHTAECSPCLCNEMGSINPGCDSYGNCQCRTGVGGPKCDECLVGFHSFSNKGCQPCDCMQIARKCHSAQSSSVHLMCSQCIQQSNWASMCNQMCDKNQYIHQQDGLCQPCNCKPTEGGATKRIGNRRCDIFTGKCALPPCVTNYRGRPATSNCTMLQFTVPSTTNNWETKSTDSYLIAGAVACFVMLILCMIIIGYIIRRKRRLQRTPMPLWTIELKQEDRSSFTDYGDIDVMYLDDSYLMDSPSELFSASTDSINERIGGYHTLS